MTEKILYQYFLKDGELTENLSGLVSLPQHSTQIYEVLRVVDHFPLFYQDHFLRFSQSCKILGTSPGITEPDFLAWCKLLINKNNVQQGNLKYTCLVTNGGKGQQNHFMYFIPHHYPDERDYVYGVDAEIFKAERTNPNAKIQQGKIRAAADSIINDKKIFEVLLMDRNGYLTEGSRSNVYFIKNKIVYTAPTHIILPGITRKYVFEAAKRTGIQIEEIKIHLDSLKEFDGAFLSGTSPKILSLRSIGEIKFLLPNNLTVNLLYEYDRIIEDYLKNYDIGT